MAGRAQSLLDEEQDALLEAKCVIDALRTTVDAERSAAAAAAGRADALQLQLAAEREAMAAIQGAAEQERERLADIAREAATMVDKHAYVSGELAEARAAAAGQQELLAESEGALLAERAQNSELQTAVDRAEQRASNARSEHARALASLDALTAQRNAERTEGGLCDQSPDAVAAGSLAPPLNASTSADDSKSEGRSSKRDPRPSVPPPLALNGEEWHVVRLAARYSFRHRVVVQVNNAAGVLCDLSGSGCQVVSSASVKPNQVVKVVIPWDGASITCAGKVAWAKLEPPTAGRPLGYRAGVQFTRADEAVIAAFVAYHTVRV
jgi:hypothetical protein